MPTSAASEIRPAVSKSSGEPKYKAASEFFQSSMIENNRIKSSSKTMDFLISRSRWTPWFWPVQFWRAWFTPTHWTWNNFRIRFWWPRHRLLRPAGARATERDGAVPAERV